MTVHVKIEIQIVTDNSAKHHLHFIDVYKKQKPKHFLGNRVCVVQSRWGDGDHPIVSFVIRTLLLTVILEERLLNETICI